MKYVDMSHVAWDSSLVIFPGLNNCHGIVFATTAGLYAYHAAVTYESSYARSGANKIAAFVEFIRNHRRFSGITAIGLYGLSPISRPNGDVENELRDVAVGTGYKGEILTARWDTVKLHWGSTWVNFARGLGQAVAATIEQYETTQDKGKTTGVNNDPQDQMMAGSDGRLTPLAEVGAYTRTNAATVMDVTDWGKLLLPAKKGKGIFTK